MDDALRSAMVLFMATYRIPPGRLDEWREANREVTEFVEAHEPRVIAFDHFVNEDGTEGTTIQIHPDSASLEHHLEVAASRIGHNVQVVEVLRIDLYGSPSVQVVGRLRRMATWPVSVHAHVHGLGR